MNRRFPGPVALGLTLSWVFSWALFWALFLPLPARAADEAPDALIRRLSTTVLDAVKADQAIRNGNLEPLIALVNKTVMPHVNFRRMTAAATGPGWRQATPEQQKRLQEEFKLLLVRTYAGALAHVSEQTIQVKPLRAAASDKDVLVRTEIIGRGDPIQLDYRLEKTPGNGAGWKVYNLNVLGVWLVETYRGQFAQQINAKGVDGLIDTLAARNKANAAAKGE
nr:ABC transporter substrate-binding protein [Verminephrobacter eiseniae]